MGHTGLDVSTSDSSRFLAELSRIGPADADAALGIEVRTAARAAPHSVLRFVHQQIAQWLLGHRQRDTGERLLSALGAHMAGIVIVHFFSIAIRACVLRWTDLVT